MKQQKPPPIRGKRFWHEAVRYMQNENGQAPEDIPLRPSTLLYFFAPAPLPGFSFRIEVDPTAVFGFSALGFFGSRLLLFWPLAMIASSVIC
ncbi:MAG: hypothetical protein WBX25_17655 [Rhodomicrobium sp.]